MKPIRAYMDYYQDKCAPGADCSPSSRFTGNSSPPFEGTARGLISGLDFLWLEITPKCNLRCLHCYSDSSPERSITDGLEYEDWRRILREAAGLGCTKVQFIGGEPTLYPHLNALIEDARMAGFNFLEVFTNGTVLTDSMLTTFKSAEVQIAVSIYSAHDDCHDEITQKRGSFANTLKNIRRALDCGIGVRACVIETPLNNNEVEDTISTLTELGIASIHLDRVRSVGRGKDFKLTNGTLPSLCGACWRGKLCIDSRGLAFPCVFARDRCVGNAAQGLQKVLADLRLKDFRTNLMKDQLRP